MPSINRLQSIFYNGLINSRRAAGKTRFSRYLWNELWNKYIFNKSGVISTVVHGKRVLVNLGYAYPLNARLYQTFNQPLLEIVHQTAKALGRPIYFADIGAAVGDTVLLVDSNCGSDIAHYYAVDGDKEFFGYLQHNLGRRTDCSLFNVLLTAEAGTMPSLVRTHQGTASAQGAEKAQSTTLDDLLADPIQNSKLDLIKIDIDGFDGRALSGSRRALKVVSAVIFEWHPFLCQQTGNDWSEPFQVLKESGFTNLIWFTKFGAFSQVTEVPSHNVLSKMADYCLADIDLDWHWDIVALKSDTIISITDLALMRFAANRVSRW